MNPPKCRSCGKSEWNHLCGGNQIRKVDLKVNRAALPSAAAKPKKKRIRLKYQRELMRKRRAAKRAGAATVANASG